MSPDRQRQGFNIVGDDELAPVQRRMRLRRTEQRKSGAWADAKRQIGVAAGGAGQANDVLAQLILQVNAPDRLLKRRQLRAIDYLLDQADRVRARQRVQHARLLLGRGVAKPNLDQKAVELR